MKIILEICPGDELEKCKLAAMSVARTLNPISSEEMAYVNVEFEHNGATFLCASGGILESRPK